jgi:hypothetical protein
MNDSPRRALAPNQADIIYIGNPNLGDPEGTHAHGSPSPSSSP